MRRETKRGFTLVEVIVTLAILAVLMAMAVPALTGYIDKTKDHALLVDGHTITMALQTTGTELSATAPNGQVLDSSLTGYVTARGVSLRQGDWTSVVNSLSAASYATASIFDVAFDGAVLTHYYYMKDDENILEYDRGGYTVLHEMPLATQWAIPAQRMESFMSGLGIDVVERFKDTGFDITNPDDTLSDEMKKELGIRSSPWYYPDFESYFSTQVANELGYIGTQYMDASAQSLIYISFNPDGTVEHFILRDISTWRNMIEYRNGTYTYIGP
jgi:prepilin-type N-terminal cleavage/methylation domain-containing protein